MNYNSVGVGAATTAGVVATADGNTLISTVIVGAVSLTMLALTVMVRRKKDKYVIARRV